MKGIMKLFEGRNIKYLCNTSYVFGAFDFDREFTEFNYEVKQNIQVGNQNLV